MTGSSPAGRTPRRPRSAWYAYLIAFGIFMVVTLDVVLRSDGSPLRWIVRELALLGYISVFAAIVSSYYKRQMLRLFGRTFIQVHHTLSLLALALLTLHPLGVAWDFLDARVFLPVFHPFSQFLRLGGRVAWYILAISSLAAVIRKRIGSGWKAIHNLNRLAFLLGTIHANLIGASFEDWPVRIISFVMLAIVLYISFRQALDAIRRRSPHRA